MDCHCHFVVCILCMYISDHGCQINKDSLNAKVQFFKYIQQ